MNTNPSVWTASELADHTAKQLPAYCDKPTERLVRYYTSIGILDKPSRSDADKRRAMYGERQFLQLALAMVFNFAGPGAVEAHKRGYLRAPNNLSNMLHEALNPGGIAFQANALKAKVRIVPAKKGGSK
jgi:hypothetical protein